MKKRGQQLALFVVVMLGGAALSLGYGVFNRDHPDTKRAEMVWVAQNLAFHGQFANPFPVRETGATAIVAPAYPFFLAMLLALFGPDYGGIAIVWIVALMHGLHAALLIQLSRSVFQDQRPGAWAAVVAVAFPTVRFMPAWEAVSAATVLLVFCTVALRWLQQRRAGVGGVALLGMLAGFLVLVNPVAALVAVIWAVLLFCEYWSGFQRPIASVACFGLMLFVTPLPWAIRSQIVLGAPVIKNTLGMTLDASNNDCASSSVVLTWRSGCYGKHHPHDNRAEADLLATMGEVKYDAFRLHTALSWIGSNSGAFLRLTVRRTFEFWFPNTAEGPYAYAISLVTLLSLAGFVMMRRKNILFLRFAAWALLLYPLVYYIVYSSSRYRVPILWISLLGAGYFLQAVWERFECWRAAHWSRMSESDPASGSKP